MFPIYMIKDDIIIKKCDRISQSSFHSQMPSSSWHACYWHDETQTHCVMCVDKLFLSESFCFISESFHKSLGELMPESHLILARNIRSEWSHPILTDFSLDQLQLLISGVFFSFSDGACHVLMMLPEVWHEVHWSHKFNQSFEYASTIMFTGAK